MHFPGPPVQIIAFALSCKQVKNTAEKRRSKLVYPNAPLVLLNLIPVSACSIRPCNRAQAKAARQAKQTPLLFSVFLLGTHRKTPRVISGPRWAPSQLVDFATALGAPSPLLFSIGGRPKDRRRPCSASLQASCAKVFCIYKI